jgi:hypothetical protein
MRPRLVSHFNSRLYPAVRLARALSRRRGRASGSAETDFKMPAGWANTLLTNILAGEARKLRRGIDSGRAAYRRGVSLMAILQVVSPAAAEIPLPPDESKERQLARAGA